MKPGVPYLLDAIAAAGQRRNPPPPPALLQEIARTPDPAVPAETAEADQSLWHFVNAEFSFLNLVREAGLAPSSDDRQKWLDLLAWMFSQLAVWPGEGDPGQRRLRSILLLASVMNWDDALWPALPEDIGDNSALLEALGSYIDKIKIGLGAPKGISSITTSEAIDRFNQADATRDWKVLSEIYPLLPPFSFANPMLAPAVKCLRRFDFAGLVTATRGICQILVAAEIAEALGPDDSFRLALQSESQHQKFACVFESLHRLRQPLTEAAQADLSKLLIQIGNDAPAWKSWMRVFNTYPVRFPSIQQALGKALASLPEYAIKDYLESVWLHTMPHQERKMIGECLRAFAAAADLPTRQILWNLAYRRWCEWDFDRLADHPFLFQISWSALDFAVVGYCVECMEPEERGRQIDTICAQVNNLDNEWYSSESHCIGARYRLLSRLQPLVRAQQIDGTEQDWLTENQQYKVAAGAGAPYYAMKYSER